MNSPPDSIPRPSASGRASGHRGTSPSSFASSSGLQPGRHVRLPNMEDDDAAGAGAASSSSVAPAPGPEPGSRRFGPPSPASTGSAIAVGTSYDAAVIQSIEQGDARSESSADPAADDTRTLTDSIRQHIVDGGLRYHAYHAGSYAFPNDETEQFRDDCKHSLILYLCDGAFFFAPVQETLTRGAQVLDLGTGTGKWCIDLADAYPQAEFHGMDLSPIQPDWVPENVSFVVDDIEHEAGWTYPESHFDYIHIRHCIHSIRDRPELWNRIYKHLKPGGYVEVQEFQYAAACDDDSCDGPYAWRDFIRYLDEGMAALGSDLHGILHVEEELTQAGFQDLWRKSLKCPVGPWAKKRRLQECGHVLRDVILWGLNGLSRRPFRDGLNWTPVQIEMFLVDVRKSVTEEVNGLPKHHSYYPFYSIYGRKPL